MRAREAYIRQKRTLVDVSLLNKCHKNTRAQPMKKVGEKGVRQMGYHTQVASVFTQVSSDHVKLEPIKLPQVHEPGQFCNTFAGLLMP